MVLVSHCTNAVLGGPFLVHSPETVPYMHMQAAQNWTMQNTEEPQASKWHDYLAFDHYEEWIPQHT